jgi:hypothetical protein
LGVPLSTGRAGIGDDVVSLHRAFPDIDVIVADMFAEHDKVVTRVIARGTHLGPLPHIPPTARRTERTLYITDSGANQEPGSYHVRRPHRIVALPVLKYMAHEMIGNELAAATGERDSRRTSN